MQCIYFCGLNTISSADGDLVRYIVTKYEGQYLDYVRLLLLKGRYVYNFRMYGLLFPFISQFLMFLKTCISYVVSDKVVKCINHFNLGIFTTIRKKNKKK